MRNFTYKKLKNVDIVFVSTLTRTLQTAVNIFENNKKVKIIALDEIKEYPQGLELCNKRRRKNELKEEFKEVDFSKLDSDSDNLWRKDRFERIDELRDRINKFKKNLMKINYQNIVIISHNNFLKELLFKNCGDESYHLDHCNPYILDLF